MRRGAALAALLLAGCAAPKKYMGIDLTHRPPTPLAMVAQRAQGGDQGAQVALGRAFEDADGVPRDLDRACRLYRLATMRTGGTIFIYQPKIGNVPGRVMPVNTGPVQPGLEVARERLAALAYRASPGDLAASACLRGARPRTILPRQGEVAPWATEGAVTRPRRIRPLRHASHATSPWRGRIEHGVLHRRYTCATLSRTGGMPCTAKPISRAR